MSGAVAVAPGSVGAQDKQYVLINLLKAVAAQLIVLHHLAFYGPMADHARVLAPALFDWLADDARIAVQVFLVIGGFLAAKSLSPNGLPGIEHPLRTIYRRYLKLAPPFLVAMLLAIGASAVAGMWMTHPSISAPPSFAQFSAHALLLHDVLGYEALSAGAWYVAIDFQLYALMTLLLWAGGRFAAGRLQGWVMPVVMIVAVSSSLFFFNRESSWDISAFYFLGSYGLGVLAWWASDTERPSPGITILLGMMLIPALAALAVDFRVRIALALMIACLLFMFGRASIFTSRLVSAALLQFAGKVSYSIFLAHFPICLVTNAIFAHFDLQPGLQAFGVIMAWATSIIVGTLFHRWVERPLSHIFALHRQTVSVTRLALKEKVLAKTAD